MATRVTVTNASAGFSLWEPLPGSSTPCLNKSHLSLRPSSPSVPPGGLQQHLQELCLLRLDEALEHHLFKKKTLPYIIFFLFLYLNRKILLHSVLWARDRLTSSDRTKSSPQCSYDELNARRFPETSEWAKSDDLPTQAGAYAQLPSSLLHRKAPTLESHESAESQQWGWHLKFDSVLSLLLSYWFSACAVCPWKPLDPIRCTDELDKKIKQWLKIL